MIRGSFGIVVVGLLVFIFIACVLAWIWKSSPRSDNIMDPEYGMTDRDDPTPHPEGEHKPWMDFQKPRPGVLHGAWPSFSRFPIQKRFQSPPLEYRAINAYKLAVKLPKTITRATHKTDRRSDFSR